jgi:[glutamine synthetase] adenylyltransferase / [glutamine synthetase]-adenylyl-L-tyrosine phosphorylase
MGGEVCPWYPPMSPSPRDSYRPPGSFNEAKPALSDWSVRDLARAWTNLQRLAARAGPRTWPKLWRRLARLMPRSPDPDMVLNNLERIVAAMPASDESLSVLLDRRSRLFANLIQLLATSQSLSDELATHPEDLEVLRRRDRRVVGRAELSEELQSAINTASNGEAVLRAFPRFRRRQLLRIGINDVIRDRPLEEITQDISQVADAAIQVALETAWQTTASRFGEPRALAGQTACATVFAFGKLGGQELNYSSDIDLMVIYDQEGEAAGPRQRISNQEFFDRLVAEMVRLLSAHTDLGQAYRVDLRLRPEGARGALSRSLESTLYYYDTLGRTWERQALIKLRPVAGDPELGRQFMQAIEPYVYRKYLSFSEINEIKTLKRKIEHKSNRAGAESADVKTGRGGIRDIEFTTQFLQLLGGGDSHALRQANTLKAIGALAHDGYLTDQEFLILDDGYRYLRRLEHRLQLLFDLQTHELPSGEDELRTLARRMGYESRPLEAFLEDFQAKTGLNRKILDHLLHETFQSETGKAEPESDLIFEPEPDEHSINSALGPYRFRDPQAAYHQLMQLAMEDVPFLSTRRCRHFLASIARRLLIALAETPDPDRALARLERVTASLGGKSVLWELFSFNPPSLKLYVDLCAYSPFLSEILIQNPGMIDELLDSLVVNQAKSLDELRLELAELCGAAVDVQPILRSFQDKELLRIGVRDILRKDTVQAATAALTDLAEAILDKIIVTEGSKLRQRLREPQVDGRPCGYGVIGLGKFGGRELGYHSDLDLMLVYEADGSCSGGTQSPGATNFQYFTELVQRVIRTSAAMGPAGRLYSVDMRLRPTGKSGSLVIPIEKFVSYYAEPGSQLWERQALTRSRIILAEPSELETRLCEGIAQAAYGRPWKDEWADEIAAMRERMEASRTARDLKRGFGGIADIEFIVQLLQLKYAGDSPGLRQPNTWSALKGLTDAKILSSEDGDELTRSYNSMRLVESRVRLFYNRSLDEIPEQADELAHLARRLGFEGENAAHEFLKELDRVANRTRTLFMDIVGREGLEA